LNLIPLLGELGLVEPKPTLGQFFDFRLGIDACDLFNFPYPSRIRENKEILGNLKIEGTTAR
jgi:hypothetical protein